MTRLLQSGLPKLTARHALASCLLILPYFVLRSLSNARHLQARFL